MRIGIVCGLFVFFFDLYPEFFKGFIMYAMLLLQVTSNVGTAHCREIPGISYWLNDPVGSVPLRPTVDNNIDFLVLILRNIQNLPRFGCWWSVNLVIILTIDR